MLTVRDTYIYMYIYIPNNEQSNGKWNGSGCLGFGVEAGFTMVFDEGMQDSLGMFVTLCTSGVQLA